MRCGSLSLLPGAHSAIPESVLLDFSEELLLMDGETSLFIVMTLLFVPFLIFPFNAKKTVWE